jgi:hypothetical protein
LKNVLCLQHEDIVVPFFARLQTLTVEVKILGGGGRGGLNADHEQIDLYVSLKTPTLIHSKV